MVTFGIAFLMAFFSDVGEEDSYCLHPDLSPFVL